MNSFADLGVHNKIVQALAENNITQPTEIQQKAIPILITGKNDFIGLAQTGTGKTAAFGLPLLHHIDPEKSHTQALILAPTRELGQQIAEQLLLFAKHRRNIIVKAVYGGVNIDQQMRGLRRPPHIIVATPGRLLDLISRRAVNLQQTTHLILDEADEMFSMGFQPDIKKIFGFLAREKSVWLFSATMSEEVKNLVNRYMAKDYKQVKINPQSIVNKNIKHQYIVCSADAKQNALQTFLKSEGKHQGVIFCRTKATAQRLAQKLAQGNLRVDSLHGDLSQNKRDKVMSRFKSGQIQTLVATDVAARGIDVQDLQYVVHYNLPEQFEYYTHRSGRTARAGKKGLSLCLVSNSEVRTMRQIARTLNLQFEELQGPNKKDLDRQRVSGWIDKVMATSVSTRNTSELLILAQEAFEPLSKEELIKKLVTQLMH